MMTLVSVFASAQTPQAIWTEDNATLTFFYGRLYAVGDDFNGHKVTLVWSGPDFNKCRYDDEHTAVVPPWIAYEPSIAPNAYNGYSFSYSDFPDRIKYAVFDNSFYNYRMKEAPFLFAMCKNLVSITGIENFKTEQVNDMTCLFYNCESLPEIDVSGFDTRSCMSMRKMFCGCNIVPRLDVCHFNTSKVEDMMAMFADCFNLPELDVSGFNTARVTDMSYMFANCELLKEIDVSGFNTSQVQDMYAMFAGCVSVKSLDVSGFNTQKVTDMSYMFSDCDMLESIYIHNFSTRSLQVCEEMFSACDRLSRIYCGNTWTADGTDMFAESEKLVGFVPYDASETGIAMANPKKYFTWDKITIEKSEFDQGVTWAESPINPTETRMAVTQSGKFSYIIDGKNVTDQIADPGKYNVTIRFKSGDGKIDYSQDFAITVIEVPYIAADFDDSVRNYCGGEEVEILFSNIRNVKPDKYSIHFSAGGFKDESNAVFNGKSIVFNIPENIQSGDYQATFVLKNSEINSAEMTLSFTIGANALKTKWDDVVYLPNPEGKFIKYQWYRDGEEIYGAKKQFYNELDGLDGTYYAMVTDIDGNEFKTCPLTVNKKIDSSAPRVNVYPNPATPGEQITLQLENMDVSRGVSLLIFTSSGTFVKRIDNAQTSNYLTLSKGGYMGYAVYKGENVSFKILVEK